MSQNIFHFDSMAWFSPGSRPAHTRAHARTHTHTHAHTHTHTHTHAHARTHTHTHTHTRTRTRTSFIIIHHCSNDVADELAKLGRDTSYPHQWRRTVGIADWDEGGFRLKLQRHDFAIACFPSLGNGTKRTDVHGGRTVPDLLCDSKDIRRVAFWIGDSEVPQIGTWSFYECCSRTCKHLWSAQATIGCCFATRRSTYLAEQEFG